MCSILTKFINKNKYETRKIKKSGFAPSMET